MKQQYIVSKFVMASSVAEAIKKSQKLPIHEVYLHGSWFEKNPNYNFFPVEERVKGFKEK